jgi:glycosyltransferase involved in cell wall biosynthesis
MQMLLDEDFCAPGEIRILYAGGDGRIFQEQAEKAGLAYPVTDMGQVSREASLALQKEADVLLVASWNGQGEQGVLTGKMLEYMMMNRPILCCMNGDIPESETKKLLHGAGMGFCYEEANGAEDEEKLLRYLRDLLEKRRKGEALLAAQAPDAVEAYGYPQIARAFHEWILESIRIARS